MNKREFKDSIYNDISNLVKSLSNAHRLEIIDLLANGEKSVEEIASQTGITLANASQHLQVLKNERLVKARRSGLQIFYSLSSKEVYFVWTELRNLAIGLSPYIVDTLSEYREEKEYSPAIGTNTLFDNKEIILLDVRPSSEFCINHIEGAISIPLDELHERYEELPIDKTIVAYCRGMFCELADEAVLLLRGKGYCADKIEENVLEAEQL